AAGGPRRPAAGWRGPSERGGWTWWFLPRGVVDDGGRPPRSPLGREPRGRPPRTGKQGRESRAEARGAATTPPETWAAREPGLLPSAWHHALINHTVLPPQN